MSDWNRVAIGDCRTILATLPDGVFQTCITSPPYFGLRDYGHAYQIGLERTPEEYVAQLVAIFREVRRMLKDDGTLWLNLGDSYSRVQPGNVPQTKHPSVGRFPTVEGRNVGLPEKNLIGIPWRVAFALQADGWYLRQDIIWAKPNPMPESVRDRCTKAHEYLFMLTKSARYFYDAAAIAEPVVKGAAGSTFTDGKTGTNGNGRTQSAESRAAKQDGHVRRHAGFNERWDASDGDERPTRNRRSVWTIPPKPYKGAHFAVMPEALVEPCILAGSKPGDVVLDPFLGSGTVGRVADRLGRQWFGCELNPDYGALIAERTAQTSAL